MNFLEREHIPIPWAAKVWGTYFGHGHTVCVSSAGAKSKLEFLDRFLKFKSALFVNDFAKVWLI